MFVCVYFSSLVSEVLFPLIYRIYIISGIIIVNGTDLYVYSLIFWVERLHGTVVLCNVCVVVRCCDSLAIPNM